jgi:hypothetical protein
LIINQTHTQTTPHHKRCVAPGRTYAAMLVLRNSAAATMKVQVRWREAKTQSPRVLLALW